MLDEHKICFIICSNNKYYLNECLLYISQLEIPKGYSIDAISILGAKSMADGYNEGMQSTDAKYKIYLHQDVFIIYKGFLQAVLDIFYSDSSIGMIGMVGAPKMPVGGVMWYGHREGELYGVNATQMPYDSYEYKLSHGLHEVEAIDGLLMITKEDICWRADKFDGWDFYDVSQSFEFRKKGYKVVVPEQLNPWCRHDDGVLNLVNYNKYRKICMEEYPEYFYPQRFRIGRRELVEDTEGAGSEGIRIIIIARNEFGLVQKTIETIKAFSDLNEQQIIIVDNGSEDGLRHWLMSRRDIDYLICEEVIEGYATILNEVIKQFIGSEDVLILSPCLMVLPGMIQALRKELLRDKMVGAVTANIITNHVKYGESFRAAIEYSKEHSTIENRKQLLVLPSDAVLIRNELLVAQGGFDERIMLPENVMGDFGFQGIQKNFCFYEVQHAYGYRITGDEKDYSKKFGEEVDKSILVGKWGLNHFDIQANGSELSYIDKAPEDVFRVLEVDCGYGVGFLSLKNNYPNVQLYGVEKQAIAAEIASHFAMVQVRDIEDKALDFPTEEFDYIILGKGVEHWQKPEEILQYCKGFLKEDGRILASISNATHYAIVRELLTGRFPYNRAKHFTYNEILQMYAKAGYTIDKMFYIEGPEGISQQDIDFVNRLLEISGQPEEFMFYAFTYVISAKK